MTRSKSNPIYQTELLISTIREMISMGELRAGQVLSEAKIIEEVERRTKKSISNPSVRAAIQHFCAHGIMEVIPKVETRIRTFTAADELRGIWNIRLSLELEVLRILAKKTEPDLSMLLSVHRELMEIVDQKDSNPSGIPTDDQRRAFIDADEKFHEGICAAAGYVQWKELLIMLRVQLRLASPAARLVESWKRMEAIVQEHQAIIAALRGGDDLKPDLNRVQYAFLVHMHTAARDSWKIEGTEASILHHGFEMPDLPPKDPRNRVPLSYPFLMRYCAEMNAVWNLALNKNRQTSSLDSNHNAMRNLCDRATREKNVSAEIQREFCNHDMDMHSGICFLGGLLFGEDVITYVWRKIHVVPDPQNQGEVALTLEHMKVVVKQHDAILNAIKNSRGTVEDAKAACRAMVTHLSEAFIGHNLNKTEQQETSKNLTTLAKQLEKIWVTTKKAR